MAENPWIPLLELTGTFFIDNLPELDTEQLLGRALKAKDDAEKEFAYAETISEILMSESESPESKKSMATIGVWHFECAVELLKKAIRNFERAKLRGLENDKQKETERQIKKCQTLIAAVAAQRKSAGDLLNSTNGIL